MFYSIWLISMRIPTTSKNTLKSLHKKANASNEPNSASKHGQFHHQKTLLETGILDELTLNKRSLHLVLHFKQNLPPSKSRNKWTLDNFKPLEFFYQMFSLKTTSINLSGSTFQATSITRSISFDKFHWSTMCGQIKPIKLFKLSLKMKTDSQLSTSCFQTSSIDSIDFESSSSSMKTRRSKFQLYSGMLISSRISTQMVTTD